MKKICIVVSSPMTVKAFLWDQLRELSERYEVHVVANAGASGALNGLPERIRLFDVGIEREISLWKDAKSLVSLVRHFRQKQYDLVHSFTPKAGLLAMTAAALSGVPVRLHTFTGQVWARQRGVSRFVMKTADRMTSLFSTSILIDSASQRKYLLHEGVVRPEKSSVLANGSVSGVDTVRFCPNAEARSRIRRELNIPEKHVVILFVGRLHVDKGLLDLANAFAALREQRRDLHLLVVGPDEGDLRQRMRGICSAHRLFLHFVNLTDVPESYMAASDIFCLPSYREGFGSVIIEAASAGLPAVGSDIYGITDAIDDRCSGVLFRAGDVRDLARALFELIEDSHVRLTMGERARKRAVDAFSKEKLNRALIGFYDMLLGSGRGCPAC